MKVNTHKVQTAFMECGMGQRHFAREAQISNKTLYNVLNGGSCSPRTLSRIADLLQVDPESLRG